jgi:hypothetical protein
MTVFDESGGLNCPSQSATWLATALSPTAKRIAGTALNVIGSNKRARGGRNLTPIVVPADAGTHGGGTVRGLKTAAWIARPGLSPPPREAGAACRPPALREWVLTSVRMTMEGRGAGLSVRYRPTQSATCCATWLATVLSAGATPALVTAPIGAVAVKRLVSICLSSRCSVAS